MNIVLQRKNAGRMEYLVYSIKRNKDGWESLVKKIGEDGKLIDVRCGIMASEKAARDRIKTMIHIKMKKQTGWQKVELETLSDKIVKFLEVPPDMQVSPEEMVLILRKAKQERYVYFKNVAGIEDCFDMGVQYLGYVTEDDNLMKVFDKCGTLRDCFIHRLEKMEPTERALEVEARQCGEF